MRDTPKKLCSTQREHLRNNNDTLFYEAVLDPNHLIKDCDNEGNFDQQARYRMLDYSEAVPSASDTCVSLQIDEENRVLYSPEKVGYSSSRVHCYLTHGWTYYQIRLHSEPSDPEKNVRFGWSSEYTSIQAPCGHKKASFSMRASDGAFFANSRKFSNNDCPIIENGSILGTLIYIPEEYRSKLMSLISSVKKYPMTNYKGVDYFLRNFDRDSKMSKIVETMKGSFVEFFVNGRSIGKIFQDLPLCLYLPMISIFGRNEVGFNFDCVPYDIKNSYRDVKSLNDRIAETEVLKTLADIAFNISNFLGKK